MSTELLSTHALGCFLTDVLRPLRARLARAVHDGCDWQVRWARSEAAEAQRFLLIGRTLGLFSTGQSEALLRSQADLWDEGALAVAAWTHAAQIEWRATNEMLQVHTVQPVSGLEGGASRRARGRSVALLQSNLLASSRLGHGLAAEVLALLSFGYAEDCLDALHALLVPPDGREADALHRWLLAALDDPVADPPVLRGPLRSVALVASVFHAVQYIRALGYMHQERDTLATKGPAAPDVLLELLGMHTGDLLHRTQFWRLNVLDAQFEHDFLEALKLAALALFSLDPGLTYAQPLYGASVFAEDVAQRWRRTTEAWASIHSPPEAMGAVVKHQPQEPDAPSIIV